MSSEPTSDATPLHGLARDIRGQVIVPGHQSYDRARAVWNARFDRHPAAVVRCAGPGDVVAALAVARECGLPVAVRGGGHDYAGNSVCDDGIVIDLSLLDEVRVDAAARIVRVGAGARWQAVDRAAQEHGLATVGGTVSTVGVAGFILGGGMGHLTRRFGLAVDNLVAAEVVTTGGEVVRADAATNPDLFWALRGGGGNFGVVTSFDLRLHEVGPEVLAGQIVYPVDDAETVLRAYRELTVRTPDELACYAFFIRVPPLDVFPAEHHGTVVIDLVVVHSGDLDEGRRLVQPLRDVATPILDAVGPQPFVETQQTFDAGVPAGLRWYSRAHELDALSDDAVAIMVRHARQLAGPFTMAYLCPMGGAAGRVEPTATAYPHRSSAYSFHALAGWQDPAEDEATIGWARRFHEELASEASGGVYVNLLAEDEAGRVRAAYGPNYDRLAAIKRRWDPDNLLCRNHNIPPAS